MLSAVSCAQAQTALHSYADIRCDSVVIYDYNGRYHSEGREIVYAGILINTVSAAARLSPADAAELSHRLMQDSSYGSIITAACVCPDMGIVYWQDGKPLAYVSLGTWDRIAHTSIDIAAKKQGGEVEDGGMIYRRAGMSDTFLIYLKKLKGKYGM